MFAWYTLIGAFGSALGLIVCGWLVEALKGIGGLEPLHAYRVTFGVYAALGLVKLVLALMLGDECEPEPAQQTAEQAIADAQHEAEEIRSRARQEAEQIIADAKARAERL